MDKNQLQEKLVEILTSIQTAAGKASDFALEQLPDITQSYVMYGRVYNTFIITLSIVLIFILFYGAFRINKNLNSYDKGAPFGIAFLISVIPSLLFISYLSNFLLVWFAPKVWLLKEIASLLR